MREGEQSSSRAISVADPHTLLATTLAALVFAGSAYFWRSRRLSRRCLVRSGGGGGNLKGDSKENGSSSSCISPRSATSKAGSSQRAWSDSLGGVRGFQGTETKQQKAAPRSKERRRRGKDNTKDILKSEKKFQTLVKSARVPLTGEETVVAGQPLSHQSLSTTSAGCSPTPPNSFTHNPHVHAQKSHENLVHSPSSDTPPGAFQGYYPKHAHDVDSTPVDPTLTSLPTLSPTSLSELEKQSISPDLLASRSMGVPIHSREFYSSGGPQDLASSTVSLSSLSTSSRSSTASVCTFVSSVTLITPNSPPELSLSDKDIMVPSDECSSHPGSPYSSSLDGSHLFMPSLSPTRGRSHSSDFPEAFESDPPHYRRRLRSKSSKSSVASDLSSSLSVSVHPCPTSPPPYLAFVCGEQPAKKDLWESNRLEDGSSKTGTANESEKTSWSDCNLRPSSTPSAECDSASPVSAQTQLASLRGALEASRLREDDLRGALERCNKELGAIRSENMAQKRKEIELQTQMNHVLQQIQGYAAVFGPPLTQLAPPIANYLNGTIAHAYAQYPLPPAQYGAFASHSLGWLPHPIPNLYVQPPSYSHPAAPYFPASHQESANSPLFTFPSILSPRSSVYRPESSDSLSQSDLEHSGDSAILSNQVNTPDRDVHHLNETVTGAILKRPELVGLAAESEDRRSGATSQEIEFPSISGQQMPPRASTIVEAILGPDALAEFGMVSCGESHVYLLAKENGHEPIEHERDELDSEEIDLPWQGAAFMSVEA